MTANDLLKQFWQVSLQSTPALAMANKVWPLQLPALRSPAIFTLIFMYMFAKLSLFRAFCWWLFFDWLKARKHIRSIQLLRIALFEDNFIFIFPGNYFEITQWGVTVTTSSVARHVYTSLQPIKNSHQQKALDRLTNLSCYVLLFVYMLTDKFSCVC